MGLFKHKSKDNNISVSPTTTTTSSSTAPSTSTSASPAIPTTTTYHITQSLSGQLTVTPNHTSQPTYSIILTRPDKTKRDSIDICVQCQNTGMTVGHCLIQVTTGKFLDCTLGESTNETIQLKHSGHGAASKYALSIQGLVEKGKGLGDLKWVHDEGSLHGAMVNADRRFRLQGADSNSVLARFAGSSGGVSEFGMLEVYPQAATAFGTADKVDWCGLVLLTAVSVYAREERHREKKSKVKSKFEGVSLVGDLLGITGGI